jgi:integrase
MSLRNRAGIWHYRFKFDGREYGQTTHLVATKRNETLAHRMEADLRRALEEGRAPIRKIRIIPFDQAAEKFLDWTKLEHRERPNTHRRVATSFASLKAFFAHELVNAIDEARIESYKAWRIEEHGVRSVTLRHDLHALSKFFQYARKQRWCRDNPVRQIKIPSDADAVRMHIITDAEEKTYFRHAHKNRGLHDLARLMLNQGLRPDEAVNLQKSDVNLEDNQLHIRKGKTPAARRTLDLTSESRQILGGRLAGDSKWIFPSRRCPGGHLKRLNNVHDRICEKTGLRFVLYDFRHTFATRMAQAGIDLATLASILGHSSIRMVERYVHITAEHKRKAMHRYEVSMKGVSRAERVQ